MHWFTAKHYCKALNTRTLAILMSVASSTYMTQTAWAQDPSVGDIDPNIERREISDFDIDSENVEVGVFMGVISIEDFGANALYGGRLTYHINENFFVETTYGQSEGSETSFEVLSGGAAFLTDEQRNYTYYDLSAGYNINGELFISENRVFNTDFFFSIGAGNTEFANDERFTLSLGAGYRLLLTDYLSIRVDVRDYTFNSDILGENKSVHNLMFTLGLSTFF